MAERRFVKPHVTVQLRHDPPRGCSLTAKVTGFHPVDRGSIPRIPSDALAVADYRLVHLHGSMNWESRESVKLSPYG